MPCERGETFVSQRLRADAKSTADLEKEQAKKHQARAEQAQDSAEVRQDARANREHHGRGEANRKRVPRSAPDTAMVVGKRCPDTHATCNHKPGVGDSDEAGKA